VALILLWDGAFSPRVQWTLTLIVLGTWLGFVASLRHRVIFPLQTLSNLLAALREGDYSIRGREASVNDPLSEVTREVNALAQRLRDQRLDALEATALLRKVMEEIDVAVFSFDGERKLRLVNRAGERLLQCPVERLLGESANDLGLDDFLKGDAPRLIDAGFPEAPAAGMSAAAHFVREDFPPTSCPFRPDARLTRRGIEGMAAYCSRHRT